MRKFARILTYLLTVGNHCSIGSGLGLQLGLAFYTP